jgi:hypothetical protein
MQVQQCIVVHRPPVLSGIEIFLCSGSGFYNKFEERHFVFVCGLGKGAPESMEVLDPPDPVGLRPEVNSNDRHRIAQYICIVNLCRYYSVPQAGPRPPPGVGVVCCMG